MLGTSDLAVLFKASADETRLRILKMLAGEELCACNLLEAFDITQPTLSYHMRVLTECGLVLARKDGVWMRYRLNGPVLEDMAAYLVRLSFLKNNKEKE